MPHNQGRNAPPGTSVHAVHIASANAARLDLHQNILWTKLRHWYIFVGELRIFFENQGFHTHHYSSRNVIADTDRAGSSNSATPFTIRHSENGLSLIMSGCSNELNA